MRLRAYIYYQMKKRKKKKKKNIKTKIASWLFVSDLESENKIELRLKQRLTIGLFSKGISIDKK